MLSMNKRGFAGWLIVLAALFVWIIVVTVWYDPAPAIDLADKTTLLIALWWTVMCGVCVFIGLGMERKKSEE